MSQDVFKAPKAKRRQNNRTKSESEQWSPFKRPRRSKEDFYNFCSMVLEYAQYESLKQEELRAANNTSPLDSIGSTAESFTSDSTNSSTFSENEQDDRSPEGFIPRLEGLHTARHSPHQSPKHPGFSLPKAGYTSPQYNGYASPLHNGSVSPKYNGYTSPKHEVYMPAKFEPCISPAPRIDAAKSPKHEVAKLPAKTVPKPKTPKYQTIKSPCSEVVAKPGKPEAAKSPKPGSVKCVKQDLTGAKPVSFSPTGCEEDSIILSSKPHKTVKYTPPKHTATSPKHIATSPKHTTSTPKHFATSPKHTASTPKQSPAQHEQYFEEYTTPRASDLPSPQPEPHSVSPREEPSSRPERNLHGKQPDYTPPKYPGMQSPSSQSTDHEYESEDENDLITCFCMKPFAGRPMIECSTCLTWIHLSCAKIRKSNIPNEFECQRCKESKFTTRKSNRVRRESKIISA